MGQFYKTSDPRAIDFMNRVPTELMFKVAQLKQKQDDDLANQTFSLHGIIDNLQTHQQWAPALQEKVDKYNNLIDGIAKKINENPGQYRDKMGIIRQLSRDLNKELQSGDIGYMVNHFKNYQNKVKELRSNKNLNQSRVDQALSKYQNDLSSQDYSYDKETGNGSSPSLAYLTKDFDTQKYLKDNIDPKNFEKHTEMWNRNGIERVGGQLVFTNTKETVTDKQAMEIAAKDLLSNNQEFLDYNKMIRGLNGTPDYTNQFQNTLNKLNTVDIRDYFPDYDNYDSKNKKNAEKQFKEFVDNARETTKQDLQDIKDRGIDSFDNSYRARNAAKSFSEQFNSSSLEIDKKFAKDNTYMSLLDKAKLHNIKLKGKKLEKELEESNNIGFVSQQTLYQTYDDIKNQNYFLKKDSQIKDLNRINLELNEKFIKATSEKEREAIRAEIQNNVNQIKQLNEDKSYLNSVRLDAISKLSIPQNLKDFFLTSKFTNDDFNNANSVNYRKYLEDKGIKTNKVATEWGDYAELIKETAKSAQIYAIKDAHEHSQNTVKIFNFTNKLGIDKKGIPTSTPSAAKNSIKSMLSSLFTVNTSTSDIPVYDGKNTNKRDNFEFKDLVNKDWELIGRIHPNALMQDGVKIGIKKDGKVVETVLLDLSNFSNLSSKMDEIMVKSNDQDAASYIDNYSDNIAREQTSFIQSVDRPVNHPEGRFSIKDVNTIPTKARVKNIGKSRMYEVITNYDQPNETKFVLKDPSYFPNVNRIQEILKNGSDDYIKSLSQNGYIQSGNVVYEVSSGDYFEINNNSELGKKLNE